MHVTPHHQRHRNRKPPLAALLALALGLGVAAHAVGFDEKLRAPAMKNAAELRSQAQSFATTFGGIRAASPTQLITNASLARRQFDLKWQVQQAIDQRKPLDELADLGLVKKADGSYSIDMATHPEWDDLPLAMVAVLTGPTFDQLVPALIQRGFRPKDIETAKRYVATHDPRAMAASVGLPLALGFGRAVGKYDKIKRPVPDSVVVSYMYQQQRAAGEASRAWSEGMLQELDAQRGRILLSILMEMNTQATWAPEDPAMAIAEKLALVRQPDFEKQISAEANGDPP
jgi:hypothetical protein